MSSPLNVLSGAFDLLIMWSQFSEARPISRRRLGGMTDLQLEEMYQHNFSQILRSREGAELRSRSKAKTLEQKCVFIFDEMSRRDGGVHGSKFRRVFRKQLRRELKAKAKGKSEW